MAKSVPGGLRVSNDCIANLAGYAAVECYGVVGMAQTSKENDAIQLLSIDRLRKGIGVSAKDGRVVIDLHVIVEQGVNMGSVSQNLISSVKFLLKKIAELDDVDVHVHIDGMRIH